MFFMTQEDKQDHRRNPGEDQGFLPLYISGYPITPEGEPKHWNKPGREIIEYWTIGSFLGIFIFVSLPAVLITSMVLVESGPFGKGMCLSLAVMFIITLYLLCRWISIRSYETYGFAFTEENIYVRQGVYFKSFQTINYKRIQNVSYSQGPIEKRYDFFTIVVLTAGSGYANGIIGGVSEPRKLRDFIMKQAKMARAGDDPLAPGLEMPSSSTPSSETDAILKELREMKELLREIHCDDTGE